MSRLVTVMIRLLTKWEVTLLARCGHMIFHLVTSEFSYGIASPNCDF